MHMEYYRFSDLKLLETSKKLVLFPFVLIIFDIIPYPLIIRIIPNNMIMKPFLPTKPAINFMCVCRYNRFKASNK